MKLANGLVVNEGNVFALTGYTGAVYFFSVNARLSDYG